MDTIVVCLITWPNKPERLRYLEKTVQSFKSHAHATGHNLEYLCRSESEGCTGELMADLVRFCNDESIVLRWHEGKANLGANMNLVLRDGANHGEYLILLQDDWMLTEPYVDFSYYADFLKLHEQYAMVRFSWPEVPANDPRAHWIIRGEHVSGTPLSVLDPRSTYYYGDQPHMRRGTWEQEFGSFLEGGDTGEPEVNLTGRLKNSGWQIAITPKIYFQHCGTVSSLNTEAQRFGGKA